MAQDKNEKKPVVTYWAKEMIKCPVCRKQFKQEVMHNGGGRMIAGNLTEELRRNFEPSKKYGVVYPVIYGVGVCPNCQCALLWRDFSDIKDPATFRRIEDSSEKRIEQVERIFPHYQLKNERSLYDAAAYHYLALLTYEDVDAAYAPTFKKGMICLRLAWITSDINKLCPDHNFDYISSVFYRKASFFYDQAVEYETKGEEKIEVVSNMGPDIDKNYGFDGVLYLRGLLEYKYGQKENIELRLKKLDEDKRTIARLFGLGKSSKSKPGPLLEVARNVYDEIAKELKANDIFSDDDEE